MRNTVATSINSGDTETAGVSSHVQVLPLLLESGFKRCARVSLVQYNGVIDGVLAKIDEVRLVSISAIFIFLFGVFSGHKNDGQTTTININMTNQWTSITNGARKKKTDF